MKRPTWLITVPTWGDRCSKAFVDYAVPSIRAALAKAKGKARFVIHTDDQTKLESALVGASVDWRPIPQGQSNHHRLGNAHRETITLAQPGEYIAFLCSDMLVSRECFAAAEKRFEANTRVIMAAATRTYGGVQPVGASSRELLDWTMQHPHPIIKELFWGPGKGNVPWCLYFRKGKSIVLRAFHLHPFAAVKDRPVAFKGATTDFDLAAAYSRGETHVVSDPDEMSLAEVSPLDRSWPDRQLPMTVESVAEWSSKHTIDIHRWFFRENPIVIQGKVGDDCEEGPTVNKIIWSIMAREKSYR